MTVTASNSSSVPASSAATGTASVGSAAYANAGANIDITDVIGLLQKTNQELRDTLQKRMVTQMHNSYEMAKNSVDKKHDASGQTRRATTITSAAGAAGGMVGALFGGVGIKYKHLETLGHVGASVSPSLGTAGGGLGSMGVTQAASVNQVAADYISDSKSIYDKQSDIDSNTMRSFSQKITDTTRSLTDLHNAMLSATSWK
ncbi:hypothetical protein VL10_24140 [Leclercia adecarboxylata]|nr:hypothetical protein VL10_24140 [Leclercia adecarboxylata]KMN66763.1 hypothetical protein VK95_04580 [Leclercia sp. LK8]